MERHAVRRLYVGQFEMNADPQNAIRPAPAGAVASMNTHDTPTFPGYWRGIEIDDRREMGLFTAEEAVKEKEQRQATREAVLAFLRDKGLLGEQEENERVAQLAARQRLRVAPRLFFEAPVVLAATVELEQELEHAPFW